MPPSAGNSLSHKQVLEYLDEQMPPETPLAFGMHPNAEIGFKLREAETFCNSLVQLQPREAGGEGGMSMEEKAKMVLDDLVRAGRRGGGIETRDLPPLLMTRSARLLSKTPRCIPPPLSSPSDLSPALIPPPHPPARLSACPTSLTWRISAVAWRSTPPT